MYAPTRGGARGGQGDFKWNDVKEDKDRENYLGHSVMAPKGRWANNRDIHWYSKEGGKSKEELEVERLEEVKRVKQLEEEALAKALGYVPVAMPVPSTAVEPETPSSERGHRSRRHRREGENPRGEGARHSGENRHRHRHGEHKHRHHDVRHRHEGERHRHDEHKHRREPHRREGEEKGTEKYRHGRSDTERRHLSERGGDTERRSDTERRGDSERSDKPHMSNSKYPRHSSRSPERSLHRRSESPDRRPHRSSASPYISRR